MPPLRRLFFNWSQLIGVNGMSLIASIVTGIVTARSVDVAILGILTIIQGVVRLIDGVVGLQAYPTLIKLGTLAVANGRREETEGLVKASVCVELATGVLAFCVALLVFYFFGGALHLSGEWRGWAMVYAVVLLTHINSSASATLRILDKFLLATSGDVVIVMLRLLLTIACALAQAPPIAFLLAWMIAEIVANIFIGLMAWLELKRRDYGGVLQRSALQTIKAHAEFWPTIGSAKFGSTLRLAVESGDAVLVGAVFGPVYAGYLRIAKTIASAILQLGWPIHHLIGPMLTRDWVERNFSAVSSLIAITAGVSLAVALSATISVYVLGETVISLFYGPAYAPAALITTIYVAGFSLTLVGSPISPTIFAMGKPMLYSYTHLICVIVFAIVTWLLLPHFGWLTTGIAHIVYSIMWLAIGYSIILWSIRKEVRRDQVSSAG